MPGGLGGSVDKSWVYENDEITFSTLPFVQQGALTLSSSSLSKISSENAQQPSQLQSFGVR